MRQLLAAVCLVAMSVVAVNAADWATSEGSCYQKGDITIGLGIPLFPFGVYVEGDYAFHDAISGGAAIGYTVMPFSWWAEHQIPIVGRALFHPFNLKVLSDKIKVRDILDPYVGLAIGWRIGWVSVNSGYTYYGSYSGGFNFREIIGARWYPTENFYVFAEEGMGFGYINAGVGMRF